MAWQTLPGIIAMVGCLTVGGLIRGFAADVYYGKPKPHNLDFFTRLLLHRDLEILEERKAAKQQ
jgi:hypothetical protein